MEMEKEVATLANNLLTEDYSLYKVLCSKDAPSWWAKVKEDKELYIEIRKGNIIDIYYRGGRMAEIKQNRRTGGLVATAHPKYLGFLDPNDVRHYKKANKGGQCIPIYQDCEHWLDAQLEELKKNIRRHYRGEANGEHTSEKYIQGELIINERDKYIDSEFAHRLYVGERSTIRIDLVKIENNQFVFEELKRIGDSRLRTKDGKPEILVQIDSYRQFLRANKDALSKYYQTLYKIKRMLGLPIPEVKDINSVTVSPKPQLSIALNYETIGEKRQKRIDDIKRILAERDIKPIIYDQY